MLVTASVQPLPADEPAAPIVVEDVPSLGPEKRAEKLLLLPYSDRSSEAAVGEALLKGLADPAEIVRASAAYALAEIPPTPAANEALIRVLEDRDIRVRGAAAYAVGMRHISSDAVSAALRRNLREQSGAARLFSAFGLAKTVGVQASSLPADVFSTAAVGALPEMFDALRERNALATARIARALVATDRHVALNVLPLLSILTTSDVAEVAHNAREAGREIGAGSPELTREPLRTLSEGDKDRRAEAARQLSVLGVATAPVLSALGGCLGSAKEADEVRVECTRALGSLGSRAARESSQLIALLHGQNPMLARAAVQALYSTNRKMLESELPTLEKSDASLAEEAKRLIRLEQLDAFHRIGGSP